MTMWATSRKLSLQKIDACFWKEPNIHYRKKKKALGENSQKSVSTSEAPWRETELSEGHKHPSWNVEETTKEEKLINHITILPHYHSSYQQSSYKDWLSPGAKQATSHPFLSKTQAKSSSAPKQVKLGPFCKCQDVIHSTQPHRPQGCSKLVVAMGAWQRMEMTGDTCVLTPVSVTSQTSKGGRSDKADLPARIPITHHGQNSSEQNVASVISVKWQTR